MSNQEGTISLSDTMKIGKYLPWYRIYYIQGLDKIMETPENFKPSNLNVVFWLQLSREIRLCAVPFLRKMGSRDGHKAQLLWAIFEAVFLWSFLTTRQVLLNSFRFLPEFCFSEEVFFSFSNAVITFETVLLAIPNNSADFVTLASVIRAPTIWPLIDRPF